MIMQRRSTPDARQVPINAEDLQANITILGPIRMILNRHSPLVNVIQEQSGFLPGKSRTCQILNITQHIEDAFDVGLVTGVGFLDFTALSDTVNHRILHETIYNMMREYHLVRLTDWTTVLAPFLFTVYTNDQSPDNTEFCLY